MVISPNGLVHQNYKKTPTFSHLSQAMQTVLVLFAQFETSAESKIVFYVCVVTLKLF